MLTPSADRRVLRFVLEQLLEDLAEARLVADRGHRLVRAIPADRVRAEEEPQRLDRLVDRLDRVERRARQPGQALATDRRQDRIHEPVEPPELVDGARRRHSAASGFGRLGGGRLVQQVDVDADDRQRRPQLVGDDAQELGPRRIERGQLGQPRLDLGRQPALLDDPREQRGDRPEEGDLARPRTAASSRVWTLSTPTTVVVPDERHRQHPGEALDVEAADPREALVDA